MNPRNLDFLVVIVGIYWYLYGCFGDGYQTLKQLEKSKQQSYVGMISQNLPKRGPSP